MSQPDPIARSESWQTKPDPAKILLIDDDESFRRFVSKILREEGFEVSSVPSGKAGVRLAAEWMPDLVVCDLDMPEMDGYEVLATLRQDPQTADVPVVFLTGQSAPDQIRTGMNLGADDYLTKPMDPGDLLSAVNARLARARAGELQREKQMESAMRTFAGVVHDLRDPLFVVLGYTDLLKRGAGSVGKPSETSDQVLGRMQQAIGRMQAIVSETLFLAKSKMQRLPFDPSTFDVKVLCEQVIADQLDGDRVQFKCSDPECPIVGDPLRLRQALENLLANALKYSDKKVSVTLTKRSRGCDIAVTDQGIGIPGPEQARVFDPFFRASNTTGKPGHGLGLSIVKTCIEQHGGRIGFVTEAGKGSTFTIELPAAPSGVAPALANHPTNSPPLALLPEAADLRPAQTEGKPADLHANAKNPSARPAVMSGIIVDDDPLVRDVLRDLLTQSGQVAVVGEAGSVAQARQLIAQRPPEVVFLDINLPDALGFELLPHIGPTTAVVFVTSAEEYAVNAFDADAVDYLLKPVSAARLAKSLQRVRLRTIPLDLPENKTRMDLEDTFLVKTMSEKKLIKVRDVKSVIAYGEYSWVYWDKDRGALLRKALKQWESELPERQFVRVHRNAIINLAFMEKVQKDASGRLFVHLRDRAEPVAVSLRLTPALNLKLKAFQA